MPKRFFMRYNLQNGVGHFPATAAVGAALQNAEPEEIAGYLAEFDAIQAARAELLRARLGDALTPLAGKRVLFLGDSNTSDNLGYRESVCRAASLVGIDASVSGGTSSTAFGLAYTALKQADADLVSILLGTNDAVAIGSPELETVSLGEYERNMRAILSWATQTGAKVLVLAIPPIAQAGFDHYFLPQGKYQSPEHLAQYNTVLRALTEELEIPLLTLGFLEQGEAAPSFLERDGIHLNALGHEALAERWLTAAAQLFENQ